MISPGFTGNHFDLARQARKEPGRVDELRAEDPEGSKLQECRIAAYIGDIYPSAPEDMVNALIPCLGKLACAADVYLQLNRNRELPKRELGTYLGQYDKSKTGLIDLAARDLEHTFGPKARAHVIHFVEYYVELHVWKVIRPSTVDFLIARKKKPSYHYRQPAQRRSSTLVVDTDSYASESPIEQMLSPSAIAEPYPVVLIETDSR